MGHVVNLRISRKRAEREQRAEQAAANRLSHGRSKGQKDLEEMRRDVTHRRLDQHRIETGKTDEIAGRQTLDRDRRSQNEREP